jgi:ribosomal protein S27E
VSDESEQTDNPTDLLITCPHCREEMQVGVDALNSSIACPHCGQTFVATPGEQEIVDDTEPDAEEEIEPARDDELDENRIKQVASLRRSLYRARSYCVVGMITCIVTAIQLVLYAIRFARAGEANKTIGFILCAIAALIGGWFLYVKGSSINREIASLMHHDEPAAPPDFSRLSDGSQRWKNLEDMTGGK